MITFLVQATRAETSRAQKTWLNKPLSKWLWRIKPQAFRSPLPSVWGLVPIQRLAASLEVNGSLCKAAPPSVFARFTLGEWYREWRQLATTIENRCEAGHVASFPQLLGSYSPVIVNDHGRDIEADEPMTSPRSIHAVMAEAEVVVSAIECHKNRRTYCVEWSTCHVLMTSCARAIKDGTGLLLVPQPTEAINDVIKLATLPVRGFHCIRGAAVSDEGGAVEVMFANGSSYRLTLTQLRHDAREAKIGGFDKVARVAVKRNAVIRIVDDVGNALEYSPHRILHLAEPRFRD